MPYYSVNPWQSALATVNSNLEIGYDETPTLIRFKFNGRMFSAVLCSRPHLIALVCNGITGYIKSCAAASLLSTHIVSSGEFVNIGCCIGIRKAAIPSL